jgi:hypothetical protein
MKRQLMIRNIVRFKRMTRTFQYPAEVEKQASLMGHALEPSNCSNTDNSEHYWQEKRENGERLSLMSAYGNRYLKNVSS